MGYSAAPKQPRPPLFLLLTFILSLSFFSGCLDSLPQLPTTYEAHPTSISYTLQYGYDIAITGDGRYDLSYRCDLPEVLSGTTTTTLLHTPDAQTITQAGNQMIYWNITGLNETTYTLGITVDVTTTSTLLTDLSGKNAQTIQQIKQNTPHLHHQYTRPQGNTTITYIDPNHPSINNIATMIQTTSNTTNAAQLAKALFSWLKNNTTYKIHPEDEGVRPAAQTLLLQQGDCDDLSFLYISLCRAVNLPARFIRGYLLDTTTNLITATAHAWAEVYIGNNLGNNGWISVECACCSSSIDADIHQNFGVEKAEHLRLFTDDGTNTSLALALTGISVSYAPGKQIALDSFTQITNYAILKSQKLEITGTTRKYI